MSQVCFICKLNDNKNSISHNMKVILYADLFEESSGYIKRISKSKDMIEIDVENIDFYDFYNILNALVYKTDRPFGCKNINSLTDIIKFLNLLECDVEFTEELIYNTVQCISYNTRINDIFDAYIKFPDMFSDRSVECITKIIKKQVSDKLTNIEKYDAMQLQKMFSILE